MDRNTFFSDVINVGSGIIQTELLNQKSVVNVTTPFYLKIRRNSQKFVQLKMQFQLSRI